MLMLIFEMNVQDLKDRTKQFALRVMRLVDALANPKSAISNQQSAIKI